MAWTAPRTWTTGEVVTASHLNVHVRDNFNALAQSWQLPAHISGRYYASQGVSATTSAAAAADTLNAMPFIVPVTGSYDRINIICTAAAGNGRMGIYSDNAGVPGALVLDAGSVAMATPNTIVTINQALTGPAIYWLAIVFSGTPTVLQSAAAVLTGGGSASLSPYSYTGVLKAHAYAALPDPFGSPTVTTSVPIVELRKT